MHGKISTYERTTEPTVPRFSASSGDWGWQRRIMGREGKGRNDDVLVRLSLFRGGTMRELIAVVGANSTPSRRASNHEKRRRGLRGGEGKRRGAVIAACLSRYARRVHGGIITLLQSCIGEEARMLVSQDNPCFDSIKTTSGRKPL